MDYTVHGILQARILEWVPFPSPGDLPNPGIEPRSPTLQADSLPAEPQGKPKNTGVGSLSFLQGIFPIQGPNRGLLHCRWVLYLLSYEGSLNIRRNSGCIAHGILQARILKWVAFFLLQGIFPTQGLNPGLPHCRQTLYRLSHQGSPPHISKSTKSLQGNISSL